MSTFAHCKQQVCLQLSVVTYADTEGHYIVLLYIVLLYYLCYPFWLRTSIIASCVLQFIYCFQTDKPNRSWREVQEKWAQDRQVEQAETPDPSGKAGGDENAANWQFGVCRNAKGWRFFSIRLKTEEFLRKFAGHMGECATLLQRRRAQRMKVLANLKINLG